MAKNGYVPLGYKRSGSEVVPDAAGQATIERIKKTAVPATMLWIPAESMKWMDTQCLQIAVNGGAKLGRATLARAIMNGLTAAGASFAKCRTEYEIADVVRAMVLKATSEVKG